MLNPWRILGVHRGSTEEEVRSTYLELAKKHHPDAGGNLDEFKAVVVAYNTLNRKIVREGFIAQLLLKHGECPLCKGKGFSYKQTSLTARTTQPCKSCGGAGVTILNGGA